MHPRNQHNGSYDFSLLVTHSPTLKSFIKQNQSGKPTIDFANPSAVKSLNAALLACYYGVTFWDIPEGYLCPPIPGRADYIHHIADLLSLSRDGNIPNGKSILGLDIGTGANVIYPLIGANSYGWKFIGSDINPSSVKSAKLIIEMNKSSNQLISVRAQSSPTHIFNDIIRPNEQFAFTMCNPPFHTSAKEAAEGNQRKRKNLDRNKQKRMGKPMGQTDPSLNFGGQSSELWCEGGELSFIKRMVKESIRYKTQVEWFTTLVSKKDNIKPIQAALKQVGCIQVKTIDMEQGKKASRFIAWQF